jgi:nitroimidazol reductase NimA-like FMN-containing flavoprotein (pyridoxamine 5'-phosphate oxidase superfamily)
VAEIWQALRQHSFAVIAYTTPRGDPRSSGVVYGVDDGHLYVAVAPDSWKARHIGISRRVAVTVPVRRGGLLSFVFPIPPATISFHGTAAVLPPDSDRARAVLSTLQSLLPPERRTTAVLVEMTPEDVFVIYGIGVTLSQMRHPELAKARIPVSSP